MSWLKATFRSPKGLFRGMQKCRKRGRKKVKICLKTTSDARFSHPFGGKTGHKKRKIACFRPLFRTFYPFLPPPKSHRYARIGTINLHIYAKPSRHPLFSATKEAAAITFFKIIFTPKGVVISPIIVTFVKTISY